MAISPRSRAGKKFSLRALYCPGVLSVGCPADITLGVNNVCVRSKQSYLQRLGFSFAGDTGRCIKKDTNAVYLIKSLTQRNSSKVLTFNIMQSM